MGRCSYTWEEWDEKKDKLVRKWCEKETWKDSNEFCIFHDPSPEKDVDFFKKMIEEQINVERGKHNFIGYYFPEKWDFFAGRKLKIDANFMNAIFQGTADFGGATFQNAYFEGATFQGTADFRRATFQGTADFKGATFQDTGFWGATFQGTADFGGATFQDTGFGEATFQDTADFWGATFQDTGFGGATFQGTADFGGATFQNAYFGGATFQDTADFGEATFQGTADFGRAVFRGIAHFRRATFQGTADFTGAVFRGIAVLGGAVFRGIANFWGATFQDADFWGIAFQDAYFRGTAFWDVDFRGATFEKKLEFVLDRVERIDLRDAEFLSRSKVTANLKEALYQGAFIENVAFIDCRWPEDYIIYEEKHMNDEKINPSFSELETIYRDLKQNMQNHGDYTTAGEFYYREMECRKRKIKEKGPSFKELKSYGYSILKHLLRKGEKPEKSLVNWLKSCGYSFLKYTCGYGEKPFRVIASAVLIIVVVAFLFQFGGIVIGEYTPEERIIDYDVHFAFPTGNAVNDYLQCLYYSFVTFTTLGYGDIHPIGYSKAFACAEAFTGAFFIALFVVVFARKMMR